MAAARGLTSMPRNCCGRHRHPFQLQRQLAVPQLAQQFQHLRLQPLQVLQRDVEKVAAAAGRVEHAQPGQPLLKIGDHLDRQALLPVLLEAARRP
jgi:hypothetical protein